MEKIDIGIAVREIRQACHSSSAFKPFFFIVGAGISNPPIPLASDMVTHCQKKAVEDGVAQSAPSPEPMEDYSRWFDAAYPHAAERRQYLHDLIHNKPISPANLRLAHILESGRLAQLVVTPNFDNMLARGLSLFGRESVVSDHPQTAPRIDPERTDVIQIVHVHGSYWFYDCCNLRDEIVARSATSRHTTITMANLLDRILARRAPLIVGYSGWENDVIMSALRRRLDGQRLAYRLYWFCYRASAPLALPDWLREHPDVRFVIADDSIPASSSTAGALDQKRQETASDEQREPVLTAQAVMDALIRGLSLPAPKLTSDPMQFFADQLKQSLVYNEGIDHEDLYGIAGVIERIWHGRELESKERGAREIALEKVRDSLRRSAYAEVVKYALEITASHLNAVQREDLARSLQAALNQNWNTPTFGATYAQGCDLLLQLADQEAGDSPQKSGRVRDALYFKALHLLNQKNDPVASLAVSAELIKRFDPKDSSVRRNVGLGLLHGGNCLRAQKSFDAAMAKYDQVVTDFAPEQNNAFGRDLAVWALHYKAEVLKELKRFDEALKAVSDAASILINVQGETTVIAPRNKTLKDEIIATAAIASKSASEPPKPPAPA